ncbi:MAG: UDP-2,3-diacylglucosamine diphosphatase [Thermodesulfobacteriota bacterium]
MKIVFIADSHLKGLSDPNQEALCDFLDGLFKIDKLVILGDFLDMWTGLNDVVYKEYKPILKSLFALTESGVELIYIEGNHDFHMGPYFTETLRAKVCPESCGLMLGDKRVYLAHGDAINMTFGYSLLRGFLRSPVFKLLSSALPPHLIWNIGNLMSHGSRGYGNSKSATLTEKKQKIFAKKILAKGFDGVILGHSHTAGVHRGLIEGSEGFYANPGGWINGHSFLVYEDGELSVKNYVVRSENEESSY